MRALAEGNREYEQRFGFIYIVCATGKSPEELLEILNARLKNDAEIELRNAAETAGAGPLGTFSSGIPHEAGMPN